MNGQKWYNRIMRFIRPRAVTYFADSEAQLVWPDGEPSVQIIKSTGALRVHPDNVEYLRAEMAKRGFVIRPLQQETT